MFCVQLFQPFTGNMGVNLCSGNIRVPEQHLNDAQIRTVIEQMGGKGVAQSVRR
jgi:hypothetical protein